MHWHLKMDSDEYAIVGHSLIESQRSYQGCQRSKIRCCDAYVYLDMQLRVSLS